MLKNTLTKLFIATLSLTLILSLWFHTQSLKGEEVPLDELLLQLNTNYGIETNITYKSVNNQELKLDLYYNKTKGKHPVIIGIHGGGWVGSNKEQIQAFFWSFLALGFSAVNIEYRLAPQFLAPAAVEDSLCALDWVVANAEKYNLDVAKIVTSGFSAGGHLALMTAMVPPSAGLNSSCATKEKPTVAAVINLFGPTDLVDLISGSNNRKWAQAWIGNQPDRLKIAQLVSPLNYIKPGLPPILTIHGDADPTVPYSHSLRLHQGLNQAGVPNELFTIKGGSHGNFTPDQAMSAHRAARTFLQKYKIID